MLNRILKIWATLSLLLLNIVVLGQVVPTTTTDFIAIGITMTMNYIYIVKYLIKKNNKDEKNN